MQYLETIKHIDGICEKLSSKIRFEFTYILLVLDMLFVISLYLLHEVHNEYIASTSSEEVKALLLVYSKGLVQFIIVVVIGGGLSLFFKLAEERRLAAREKQAVRSEYLEKVGEAYRKAKLVRRNLRASGLTNKNTPYPAALNNGQIQCYKEEMLSLQEAQLQLEALKIQAKSHAALKNATNLSNNLKVMEKYLRSITKEYEKNILIFTQQGSSLHFYNLKNLEEFTGPSNKSSKKNRKAIFVTKFSDKYAEVTESITNT